MLIFTNKQIEDMNYTDFISFIQETNRCPGGKSTVRTIIKNSFINNNSTVLEIGSNTGFTSLEIARSIKCQVYGIDISTSCVKIANQTLSEDIKEIQKLVKFKVGSAYDIPFKDNNFDLVVAGGATSFMTNKEKAVTEYLRVLKAWGFLSITQLFYTSKPPSRVLTSVSNALGVTINPWTESDWVSLYKNMDKNLELYFYEKKILKEKSKKVIDDYINYFMTKPHIAVYSDDTKKIIKDKWQYYLDIFNENHQYLGYFIALFRKRISQEEPELF